MKNWFRRPTNTVFVGMTPAERFLAIAFLCVLGLVVAPFALGTVEPGRIALYGGLIAYLATLAMPFAWPRFAPSIFHPVVFYVIWVGIRGIVEGKAILAASGLEYHRALRSLNSSELNSLALESFLLEAVALIALYVGYCVIPRFRIPTMTLPRIGAPAFKTMVWVGISGLAMLILAHIGGGLEKVLMQRGLPSDQRIASQIGAHWHFLASIGSVAPLVWLACEKRATRRPIFWVLLFLALGIEFAVTGSRSGALIPFIMVGSLWILHNRTIPYGVILIGITATLITVGGLGQYRAATMQASSFEQVDVQGGIGQWAVRAVTELQRRGTENSGQIAVLGRVPEDVSYLWGESYLSIPFIFVPSAAWPDKPDAAGKLNAIRIYERPLTGIPTGAVGEAYWNFSYPGVVFVFLLYGVSLKILSDFYRANPNHPLIIIVFIYALFHMQPYSPSFYAFFHAVIPAIVILAFFILPVDGRLLPNRT